MVRSRWRIPLVLVAVTAFAVAASGGSAAQVPSSSATKGGPTCSGGKIKVGSVSTLSGPVSFADVPNAAKVVFDQVNAKGGINGCKFDYVMGDDKADPQVAAQTARDLVQNQGVVALAGSGSLLDCEVNGNFYHQQGIASVQGLGVDAGCWASPNIAPVNVGPFTLSTAMLYYATKTLHAKRPCVFFEVIAGTANAYKQSVEDWEKLTGKKLALLDLTLPQTGDYTPYVLRAKKAHCDAVLSNTVEPQVIAWMKIVDQQHIKGVDWLFLAPGYTNNVAKALAKTKANVYAGTEWYPYTESKSPALRAWKTAMHKAGRPLTAFSQGGFEAADVLVRVIRTINGPVTRASVFKALTHMKPIKTSLTGTAYVFGPGKKHDPNRATRVMKLAGGKWKMVTPKWVILPTP